AHLLATAGAPPSVVAGARMALERGRGRSSVPVRTTILGTTFGLAALVATATFGSSLTHLVNTPALSGWTFDAVMGTGAATPELVGALRSDPNVTQFSFGTLPDIELAGVDHVAALAFSPGPIQPAIADGRLPRTADEIALAGPTLERLHLRLGDPVSARAFSDQQRPVGTPRTLNIVGKVVMPRFFFSPGRTGEGASFTMEAVRAYDRGLPTDGVFVRVRGPLDASLEELYARVAKATGESPFVLKRQQPRELLDLQRVSNLPFVLAAVLALLAAATLAHTLVSSIRRRSREIAVLRTLGFVRAQVRSALLWQATVVALVALVIGIPAGIEIGRVAWQAFVHGLQFVPSVHIPVVSTLILTGASLLAANLIAALPARAAARMTPATALRTE
ncbi:MAG: ABC transporter permease, partial [Actinobacteria bacterium]|nr:ABC transporter permease [Actinomycetota bacterium]